MGLAGLLLGRMEIEMLKKGITTLYTIARAYSYGMNITFARSGYIFSGTLPNNTQIAGGLETMNVLVPAPVCPLALPLNRYAVCSGKSGIKGADVGCGAAGLSCHRSLSAAVAE